MISHSDQDYPGFQSECQSTSWLRLGVLSLSGAALGFVFFSLVHHFHAGFRTPGSLGMFEEGGTLNTLVNALLDPAATIVGLLAVIVCVPLLRSRRGEVTRTSLTILLVLGTMSVGQSSLQFRYDYQQTFGDSTGWGAGAAGEAR